MPKQPSSNKKVADFFTCIIELIKSFLMGLMTLFAFVGNCGSILQIFILTVAAGWVSKQFGYDLGAAVLEQLEFLRWKAYCTFTDLKNEPPLATLFCAVVNVGTFRKAKPYSVNPFMQPLIDDNINEALYKAPTPKPIDGNGITDSLRLGPCFSFEPSAGFRRFAEYLEEAVLENVLYDTCTEETILPISMMKDVDVRRMWHLEEDKERGQATIEYPKYGRMPVIAYRWRVERHPELPSRVWVCPTIDFMIVGADVINGVYGFPSKFESNGVVHVLDTGSSCDVGEGEASHSFKNPIRVNGSSHTAVCLWKGIVEIVLPGVPTVRSCNIAGIQEWPIHWLSKDCFEEGTKSDWGVASQGSMDMVCMANLGKPGNPTASNNKMIAPKKEYPKPSFGGMTREGQYKRDYGNTQVTAGQAKMFDYNLKKLNASLERGNAPDELMKAVGTLQKEVHTLRAQQSRPEGNFLANNFSAAGYQLNQLSKLNNLNTTPAKFLEAIAAVMNGDVTKLPKRFGGPQETVMFEQVSTTIVPLTGLTAGATVYVVAPTSWANRGAIVYQRVAGSAPSVLGYVTPNVDIEAFSYRHAVLGLHMGITMPTTYGGTTAVVSSVQVQCGQFRVNPACLTAGQGEANALGRHCPISVLGADAITLNVIDYSTPGFSLIHHTGFDPANSYLYQPTTSNTYACTSPVRGNGVQVVSTSNANPTSWPATGWVAQPSTIALFTGVATTFWQAKTVSEFYRHIYFGDWSVSGNVCIVPNAGAISYNTVQVRVTYADGSQSVADISASPTTAAPVGNTTTIPFGATSIGMNNFAGKRGLPVDNFELRVFNGGANLGSISGGSANNVNLIWHDVAPDETYSSFIMTGCTSLQVPQIVFRAGIEVWPDSATTTGQVLVPNSDLPIAQHVVDDILNNAVGAGLIAHPSNLQAGGFGSMVKNVAGRLSKAAAKIAEARSQPLMNSLDPTGRAHRALFAATFGEGSSDSSATGVSFLAVKPMLEMEGYEVIEVLSGQGNTCPDFTDGFRAANANYQGRSSELAFAVADLRRGGAPVAPGVYSGEIENYECNPARKTAYMSLRPVAMELEKIAACPKLCGYFVDGMYAKGKWVQDGANFFGRHVVATYTESALSAPYPEGSKQLDFKITW